MRSALVWLAAIVVTLAVAALVAGQAGLLSGRRPVDLGVRDGRLKAPSPTPNSVSSQAALHAGHPMQGYAAIDALPQRGSAKASIAALRELVAAMPGARVVEERDDYLRAEFATRWLGFVDDAEFWADPAAGVIQVRSASRLGRKDFGVNRARIETIRSRWATTR